MWGYQIFSLVKGWIASDLTFSLQIQSGVRCSAEQCDRVGGPTCLFFCPVEQSKSSLYVLESGSHCGGVWLETKRDSTKESTCEAWPKVRTPPWQENEGRLIQKSYRIDICDTQLKIQTEYNAFKNKSVFFCCSKYIFVELCDVSFRTCTKDF